MTTTLVDTGPIVALLNRQDRHHGWAVDTFAAVRPPLLTCEAVLSEAAYLLRRLTDGPEKAIEMLLRGVVAVPFRLEVKPPR